MPTVRIVVTVSANSGQVAIRIQDMAGGIDRRINTWAMGDPRRNIGIYHMGQLLNIIAKSGDFLFQTMFDYHFGYWTSCTTKSRPSQLCSFVWFFSRTAAKGTPGTPRYQSLIKCRFTSITSDEGLLRHTKTLLRFGMRNGPHCYSILPVPNTGMRGWSQRFHVCIILLVLNVGNFREWSTITINNHPIPLFPSILYQAPGSHEIGKITIATSRDFPLGFHRRCLCPQASPSKRQSACGPTLIPPLPLGIKCLV